MGGCFSCDDDDNTVYVPSPRVAASEHRPYRPYPVNYARTAPAPRAAPRVQSFSTPYSYAKPAAPVRREISVPYGRAVVSSKPEALYGEFKCICGNFWVSLLTWRDKCQQCRRCKRQVFPKKQRNLQPTDYKKDKDDVGEHPKELCQMCKELGGHCGKIKQTANFRH
uniref:3CxxC-type domain-containing protein n=1 Tax=Heliothis virescens TaxID=7102 RepID=A0A2A4K7G8_HELVI